MQEKLHLKGHKPASSACFKVSKPCIDCINRARVSDSCLHVQDSAWHQASGTFAPAQQVQETHEVPRSQSSDESEAGQEAHDSPEESDESSVEELPEEPDYPEAKLLGNIEFTLPQ